MGSWAVAWAGPLGTAGAEALFRQGRTAEALRAAEDLARERPQDVAAQELMIDVLITMGQHEQAVARARQRVEGSTGEADAHYLLGRAHIDALSSRKAYEAALHLNPSHSRSHMGMGSLHEAAGRLDDATSSYARATKGDPSLAEAWFGLVRAQMRAGDRAAALKSARAGLEALPLEPRLSMMVAELDPKRAREVLQAALAKAGPDVDLRVAMAGVLLQEGDAEGASEYARKVLATVPDQPEARRTLLLAAEVTRRWLPAGAVGEVSRALASASEEPARALSRAQSLVRAHPKSALAMLARASAKRASGDEAGELADLQAAARLDPANEEVASVTGFALLRAGRAADAIGLLTTAMSARPGDANLGLGLAQALADAGYADDERLLLERVAAAHPRNVDVQLVYAQRLLEAGAPKQAYGVLKISMQLTSDPRLVAAFVQVAPVAGHASEAADLLDTLAERTGSNHLREIARKLRVQ